MSFLGYDRGRLTALGRRLDDVADEAAGLQFGDALAGDAAGLYRGAVALMTGWRADLDAIASCRFDSPYQPVLLDAADPMWLDVLRPTDAAWATVTDPRSGQIVSAEDHARHLAEYLAAVDVGGVVHDRRRVDELLSVLTAVTTNAATRDIFLATLSADRFGSVAEALAEQVASSGGPNDAGRVLAGLAAGYGASYRAGTIERLGWDIVLTDHDPYALALVLQSAGLAGDDLARLAASAWYRWNERRYDGIDETAVAAEQTPAILLGLVTTDPVAARRMLERFDDDDLAVLFGSDCIPAGHVLPFLLASADPRSGAPDEMRESMVAVLTFLRQHQDLARFSGVSEGLGAYVGPYLEQLMGAHDNSGFPVEPWDVAKESRDRLGWIALDETAAQTLLMFSGALVMRRFAEFAASGSFTGPQLDHLGAVAGTVDRMVADAHILEAEEREAAWGDGVAAVSSLIPGGSAATLFGKVVLGQMKRYVVGVARDMWEAAGLPPAPPPSASVATAENAAISEREDRRVAEELAVFFAAARATGAVPASSAPPAYVPGEDYIATRNAWVNEAGIDPEDAAARQALWHAAEAYDDGVNRET